MGSLARGLNALALLAPGEVLSQRLLKDVQVGEEELRSGESVSVGQRAVRLSHGNWYAVNNELVWKPEQ